MKEKSFLQSIKLEISRSFNLVPYERLAFHKIMGMLKSDTSLNILLKELDKGPDIRGSALSILVNFKSEEVLNRILPLLTGDITPGEKIKILKHVKENGIADNIQFLIDFINSNLENPDSYRILISAFDALKSISEESDEVLNYLLSIVNKTDVEVNIKALALHSLAQFKAISTFENILKEGDDTLCYSVYRALYEMNTKITDEAVQNSTEESALFTYSQDEEDKVLLDIRVLLGKLSTKFDNYSDKTKIAFICAMISCNHREFLIYTMKALTSENRELIIMTLYALYININRVRDPDKLFRNLIALSTETDIENDLIISIFVKFFTTERLSRQFNILKDKLYSYIVVTLETYFESYRKEFLITDVVEKGYPESFQNIRRFILEKLNPEYKKKILNFLVHDEPASVRNIVREVGNFIKYIEDDYRDTLSSLIDVFFDKDIKSRENSASRIEDLNFEKRYLRNRIIRLCRIIGRLYINDGSSALVNIYNYLKKYPDPEITDITIHTLSILNYSYMLGEIEVLLTTGSDSEQVKSLQLVSLFTEQRSLNVILEFIGNNIDEDSEIVELAINILIERDIIGNATANQILKKVIDITNNTEILKLAVLGVGRCGLESDTVYLNDLFYKITDNDTKDHVVRAIGSIITISAEFDKRTVVKYLAEYLKDPGIRVRVYSCLLLVKLGNKDALKSIRDMLIIKNKSIQREILTILGDLRSVEFSFFLVSLLKEEYGITDDIISVLELLPVEDLKEIDSFIVNIFRKYEAPDLGDNDLDKEKEIISISHLKLSRITLINIDINYEEEMEEIDISELINMNLRIKSLIVHDIVEQKGLISRMSSRKIAAVFIDPVSAITASLAISENMNSFRKARIINKKIQVGISILTDDINVLNEEILDLPEFEIDTLNSGIIRNRIIIDENTFISVEKLFAVKRISELLFKGISGKKDHFELLYPINFHQISNDIIEEKIKEGDEKEELNSRIENELKKLRLKSRTSTSISIAGDLDDLGLKLGKQLKEIEKYVQKRTTDRELIQNVRKMLTNVHNLYKVEISRLRIE